MEEKATGRILLKVIGILMAIFAIIGIIYDVYVTIKFAKQMSAYSAYLSYLGYSLGKYYALCVFAIIASVVQLFVGIYGVKNCNNKAAANKCLLLAIICIILVIISFVISKALTGTTSGASLIAGVILPILYLVGAILNK